MCGALLQMNTGVSCVWLLCRAKNITNKPKINEDPKDAMLREFQEEIAKLKAQLAAKQAGEGGTPGAAADVEVGLVHVAAELLLGWADTS